MDAAPGACPDRPLTRSYPHNIFGGIKGLALAARFCRTQDDEGVWSGLPDLARRLEAAESYRIKDSDDWKVKCACEAVHVVPRRELVFCSCDRIFMADDDAAWVFELGPQDPE